MKRKNENEKDPRLLPCKQATRVKGNSCLDLEVEGQELRINKDYSLVLILSKKFGVTLAKPLPENVIKNLEGNVIAVIHPKIGLQGSAFGYCSHYYDDGYIVFHF